MILEFSDWQPWLKRFTLPGLKYPGVYCLAISDQDLSNKTFDWIVEIKYIGMTNSIAGLVGRLQQFDNTIKGKSGHGGADRFRNDYHDYQELIQKLFVSVCFFKCDVKSVNPYDLIMMGEVAKYEYVCFSEYSKIYYKLPLYNDKKKSPKHSKTSNKSKT